MRLLVEGEPSDAVCALALPELLGPPEEAPPSVLLVTSDTHRADHLGTAKRSAGAATPFLDELAERGLYFEDCFASIEVTNPSHASLLTGLSPRDTGILTNDHQLAGAATTLAEQFRAAGYATFAALSVRHLRHDQSGLGQGFVRIGSPPGIQRDSSETIEELRGWLAEVEGYPLFVWLHVFDAHDPYEPPAELERRYYPTDSDPYDPQLPAPGPKRAPRWDPGVRDLDYPVALYKSEVTYLDGVLADFFEGSRFQDGLVAVTADHGESLTAHGVYFAHLELYPDTLAVPLILAGPGVPRGRVERPVRQLDVGRTLLDLAGLEQSSFPGENLVATRDSAPSTPRFALGTYGASAAIVHDGWLLILHLKAHERGGLVPVALHEVELYQLDEDPACETNLVLTRLERARSLRAALLRWLEAAPDETLAHASDTQSKQVLEELAALGYAASTGGPSARTLFEPDGCDWCQRFE